MSEQENVEVITRIYEAFGKGDIPFILEQLHDDVQWVVHQEDYVPTSGNWSSKAKVPGFFQAINDSMELSAFGSVALANSLVRRFAASMS